jgi:hypothetical protein
LIQARTPAGVVYFHVAHLLECIEYDTLLRTYSINQVIRHPIPLGYDLLAETWNADAAHISTRQFATISLVTSQSPEVLAAGDPISMADFLVTAEDCGLTENKPADSEMLALTRFVAMGAVHSQQLLQTTTIITCLLFFFTCSYMFLIVSIFTEHAGEHELPNTCATCVCLTKYVL